MPVTQNAKANNISDENEFPVAGNLFTFVGTVVGIVVVGVDSVGADGVPLTLFEVPTGLVGDHNVVLFEAQTGTGVRQEVTITSSTLPATGASDMTTRLSLLAVLLLMAGFFVIACNKSDRKLRKYFQ